MYLCKTQSINVPEHLSHELIILQNIFYIKKKTKQLLCFYSFITNLFTVYFSSTF